MIYLQARKCVRRRRSSSSGLAGRWVSSAKISSVCLSLKASCISCSFVSLGLSSSLRSNKFSCVCSCLLFCCGSRFYAISCSYYCFLGTSIASLCSGNIFDSLGIRCGLGSQVCCGGSNSRYSIGNISLNQRLFGFCSC